MIIMVISITITIIKRTHFNTITLIININTEKHVHIYPGNHIPVCACHVYSLPPYACICVVIMKSKTYLHFNSTVIKVVEVNR